MAEKEGGVFAKDLGNLWAAISAPFSGWDIPKQTGGSSTGWRTPSYSVAPGAVVDPNDPGNQILGQPYSAPAAEAAPSGGGGLAFDRNSELFTINGQTVGGLDASGKPWWLPGFGAGGQGGITDLGNGYVQITQPDGSISLQRLATGGGGGGGANLGYGGMLSFDQQMAMQGSQQEANRLLQEIQNQSAERIAQINADTSLSAQEKQVQIAEINRGSAREAAEIAAGAQRYIAELGAQSEQKRLDAERAIAEGNLQLGYAQLESSERIAAAKAQLEREVAGLQAYTQLLGIESTERANRAQAAASVFKSLADATPGEMLRSAWYFTRGQAPPPTLAEKMPRGLLSALGVNADTVTAAAQEMRGQTSVPPFLAQLMSGQMAS